MAKKSPVRSLSDSSLAELANLVVSAIGFSLHSIADNDYVTITMVEVNSYLSDAGATSDIYQDLLRVILASDYLEASMRFTCLQMLLNGGVNTLITDIFPFSYYEKILQVIAAQGAGLRILNLKGVWVKEEHMHYMMEIIKKCPHLTKLYIPYIANDELLECIAKSSSKLRLIDISGETDITENGVEYLSKGLSSAKLTVVDIGMPGEENICHSDVAMLLERCPNLETLGTYSFVGQALKFVYDNVDSNFKSKLKYLHDTHTDGEQLEIIVTTCPNLETLYLDTPKEGILSRLKYTKLRKLKIYKFQCDELLQLLENIGKNLSHLTVIKGRGTMELGKLARLCPSLIDLDFYMMDQLTYNIPIKFDSLHGLEMLNSPLSMVSLKHFICNNTSLRRLAVDSVIFGDEDLESIFVPYNFKFLEDIWFTSAPNLTVASIELLIDRCPELQSIGQISGWALTPDDLALVRGILKSGNSSLNFYLLVTRDTATVI
ncbi:uncharacterized protein LOC129615273 isoform X2 [Condylostylus longicornis]|uniref:uncharacterized protein LOC129615273 isoform X2 n=1 Tax=Condylostylus longicornis TaxID=2530218 RepID=UPI00244DC644|nr:uncharacterized protein LOC129615273 isoform X2 [Condylostylus longicornis]